MQIRSIVVGGLACAATTLSTPARAQDYQGSEKAPPHEIPVAKGAVEGNWALSAERIMAITFNHRDDVGDEFNLAILANPNPLGSVYQIPRFGLDYFIVSGVSIGGSVYFMFNTASNAPDSTAVGVVPRVGYMLDLARNFAIWPRAGITYSHFSAAEASDDQLGFNLEALFVGRVTDSFRVTAGPTLDIGLTGGSETVVGLNFGMMGMFN